MAEYKIYFKKSVWKDFQSIPKKDLKKIKNIKKEFEKNGRGHKETKKEDMFWCNAKAENLQDEGVIISGRELYNFCIKGG